MSNNRFASINQAPKTPLDVFDRLPAAYRHAQHAAVIDWNPRDVPRVLAWMLRNGWDMESATDELIASLAADDAREVATFSALHKKRFGVPSPHVAAGATIQPYECGY